MLTTEKRAVLENTLRNLPLTHFSCLEKVLQHLKTAARGCNSWYRVRGFVFNDLRNCSSERLKAYLIILTTPGRNYAIPKPLNKDAGRINVNAHAYKPNYWRFLDGVVKNVEGKKSWAHDQADWISLQRAIQDLPLELNLLVRDTLFEELFGPGKEIIFPYEGRTYTEQFRALDRRLYDKYSYTYYCENKWVIGEGSAKWLIEASKKAMPPILPRIRNIALKWSWRDAERHGPIQPGVQRFINTEMEIRGAEEFDNLHVMQKFKDTCNNATSELLLIWWGKSTEIGKMQLDMLVIDAREAFAPDGEFLGLDAARQWEESDRPPYIMEIWVPNDDKNLADRIVDIIVGRYSW